MGQARKFAGVFSNSNENWCNFNNCVPFFDLRNKTPEIIECSRHDCDFLNNRFLGDRIVYLFLDQKYYGELIFPRPLTEGQPWKRVIYDVECGIPSKVPIASIKQIIDLTISKENDSPGLGDLLKQALERQKRNSPESPMGNQLS
jgi:hypothetical protein